MKSHFSQLYVSTPAATASLWVTVFKEWLTVEKDAKAWFSYGWCGWSVFINFLRKWKFSPNFFFIEHTLCLISFLLEAFIKNESITPCPTPRKKKREERNLADLYQELPSLAHCFFLCDLWDKNGFYIFKWSGEKNQKKNRVLRCENYLKFRFQCQ